MAAIEMAPRHGKSFNTEGTEETRKTCFVQLHTDRLRVLWTSSLIGVLTKKSSRAIHNVLRGPPFFSVPSVLKLLP